ncbi:MAG: phosphomannomutase, partial [Candidatus Binatia bacterium]
MNPAIFREYDLRGLAEKDFDDGFARLLGKVFGSIVRDKGGKRVAVGRDCRFTSDRYAEAVIEGLISAGLLVYDIGVCPSPLLYFSLFHLDLDGGVQITASHNPSEYNGFKLCVGKVSIYGSQIQELRKKIENKEFRDSPGGSREEYSII